LVFAPASLILTNYFLPLNEALALKEFQLNMQFEKVVNWAVIIFIPVLLFILTPLWDSILKESKQLQYVVINESAVINKELKNEWPDLKFHHGKDEIDNLRSFTFIIVNTGKVPIKSSDFEKAIDVVFDGKNDIKANRIANKTPDDLDLNVEIKGRNLSISPLLLNPGDQFSLDVLSNSELSIKSINSRIVGLKSISEIKQEIQEGIYIQLIEQTGPGRTTQKDVMKISMVALFISTVTSAICSFIFLFAFLDKHETDKKIILGFISLNLYIVTIFFSSLIPEAIFGFTESKWMDYISMFLVLLFGALISIPIKGIIKDR
jgi:hypothetical protein